MKKIKVVIHRQTRVEPSEGTLRAYVVEANGARGENMLAGRKWTSIDSAVQEVDRHLLTMFKLIDPPEIEYVIEDDKAAG